MIRRFPRSAPRSSAPDEAASDWLVRLDGGVADRRTQAEFDAWYAECPENAAAFARAGTMWKLFDHAEDDHRLEALREAASAMGPARAVRLRTVFGGAIAASLAAILIWRGDVLPSALTSDSPIASVSGGSAPSTARPDDGDFVTARGERRSIDLADGSVLTLNTDSAVRIAYSEERRRVEVLHGQVLFEVAKDHRRPFVVEAADRRVTALGTVFQVWAEKDRMKVTLVEGRVAVDAISDRTTDAVLAVSTVLKPGEEFAAAVGASPQLTKVDAEQQLRWREGFVEFDDVSLADAVQEMNRYSIRQIVIEGDEAKTLRISGVFRTGNSERFAAIVCELLPVEYHDLADSRIAIRARSPELSRDEYAGLKKSSRR